MGSMDGTEVGPMDGIKVGTMMDSVGSIDVIL